MQRFGLILCLGLAAAACGGTSGDDATTGASSSTSGAGGSTSAAASNAATTTSATTSVATSTSASTGSGGGGQTVTLTMDSFDVPSGGEVYKCQNFANPFQGKDVDISEFESHMALGSHHMLLFYEPGVSDGPLEDCSGLEFAATPYSTQLPDDSMPFPPGVAAHLPASEGFRVQSHYLNVTGSTIHAQVQVTFHLADSGTITAHAGVLFLVQDNIDIPPDSTSDVTFDCHLPQDMNLLKAASHMHKHGTNFTSTIAGQTYYQTNTWDEPKPEFFNPPLAVHKGDPLHFDCTFVNDTAQTLTFGESAQSNEMCILGSNFYPVPDGVVTIDCQ